MLPQSVSVSEAKAPPLDQHIHRNHRKHTVAQQHRPYAPLQQHQQRCRRHNRKGDHDGICAVDVNDSGRNVDQPVKTIGQQHQHFQQHHDALALPLAVGRMQRLHVDLFQRFVGQLLLRQLAPQHFQHADLQRRRQIFDLGDVRQALAPLPLADGRRGNEQFFGQLFLGQAQLLAPLPAKGCKFFCVHGLHLALIIAAFPGFVKRPAVESAKRCG